MCVSKKKQKQQSFKISSRYPFPTELQVPSPPIQKFGEHQSEPQST